ncbi:MAG: IMP dehydrogenase, partial [Candidatus Woesearchaeota archaeon]
MWEPGRTFSEFSLLPGYTEKDCVLTNISLETKLAEELELGIPLLSAAMTSVTGLEMCSSLGRAGGMGVLPAKMPDSSIVKTIEEIKALDLSFVEDPICVHEDESIENVVKLIERHGYSTIPVVDRFRHFKGLFVQEEYWKTDARPEDLVTKAMIPYSKEKKDKNKIEVSFNPDISIEKAKDKLSRTEGKYIVVLDRQERLRKMAFKQDMDEIKVGVAISTYEGWKKRTEKALEAGADLIVIDTSDAYNAFVGKVLERYNDMNTGTPICAGNVVTYDGAMFLLDKGADIVKTNMSVGSICTTQREKATGRAPMAAVLDVERARQDYARKNERCTSHIADGGMPGPAEMIIALSVCDAVMMGGYFNGFYEAAAPKLDKNKKPTTEEDQMRFVETWGEGSERARNLYRYGHSSRKTFFEEGAEGTVPYKGRLKPCLEKDMAKLRAALSTAGAYDLPEY